MGELAQQRTYARTDYTTQRDALSISAPLQLPARSHKPRPPPATSRSSSSELVARRLEGQPDIQTKEETSAGEQGCSTVPRLAKTIAAH